jgi:hypothetical protein
MQLLVGRLAFVATIGISRMAVFSLELLRSCTGSPIWEWAASCFAMLKGQT